MTGNLYTTLSFGEETESEYLIHELALRFYRYDLVEYVMSLMLPSLVRFVYYY